MDICYKVELPSLIVFIFNKKRCLLLRGFISLIDEGGQGFHHY